MIINIILFLSIESEPLCPDNAANNDTSLALITFDSGSDQYSNATPSTFNFSTTHQQIFNSTIVEGMFAFVNTVPNNYNAWHTGALDHTAMDQNGYMFLVNVANGNDRQLFTSTVNGLCIGLRYEFSAFLANVVVESPSTILLSKPNVRFEVRASTVPNDLLAESITGEISRSSSMTWTKYGVSFNASSHSVVLLMISNIQGDQGNDLAIDDIELRVCSTPYTGFCPSG
jgi:hypothetical protein